MTQPSDLTLPEGYTPGQLAEIDMARIAAHDHHGQLAAPYRRWAFFLSLHSAGKSGAGMNLCDKGGGTGARPLQKARHFSPSAALRRIPPSRRTSPSPRSRSRSTSHAAGTAIEVLNAIFLTLNELSAKRWCRTMICRPVRRKTGSSQLCANHRTGSGEEEVATRALKVLPALGERRPRQGVGDLGDLRMERAFLLRGSANANMEPAAETGEASAPAEWRLRAVGLSAAGASSLPIRC
ncbi:hypothetical protein GGR45_003247 [Sphingomonas zeae]|nr:hypothetical protein [Sphingomonas zeae]